jgi:hypothetical protein
LQKCLRSFLRHHQGPQNWKNAIATRQNLENHQIHKILTCFPSFADIFSWIIIEKRITNMSDK